jgi:2'-5' RNA ligase
MGLSRRITNGIYFWENPYDQFGVWTYQSYWSDPKTEKEIVSEDQSNYEYARDLLYAYPDEKDYSPHPTIALKNYREGIDDFKYFKTLRSCSIEKFKLIQEKYQKYGPEAERYSGYLDALTLQKIRLETAKEILNCN